MQKEDEIGLAARLIFDNYCPCQNRLSLQWRIGEPNWKLKNQTTLCKSIPFIIVITCFGNENQHCVDRHRKCWSIKSFIHLFRWEIDTRKTARTLSERAKLVADTCINCGVQYFRILMLTMSRIWWDTLEYETKRVNQVYKSGKLILFSSLMVSSLPSRGVHQERDF